MRVEDEGESECHSVMEWIGVEPLATLLHAKAGRLPSGLSSRENLANRLGGKADDNGKFRWCSPRRKNVRRLQARIVKAASRVPIRALERLERHMAKVIRVVLRGGGDSNAASLPDTAGIFSHVRFFLKCASSPKEYDQPRRRTLPARTTHHSSELQEYQK